MLKNYIKIALKVLMRRKFFTAISLFGISFTLIVLNVATSFVDKVVSNTGTEKNMDKMLISGEYRLTVGGSSSNGWASMPVLNRYFKDFNSAENQTFYSTNRSQVNFTNNKKYTLNRRFVDQEYWNVFNFSFLSGRPFSKQEYDQGERVVIITKRISDIFFEGSALNKNFTVESKVFKVIGVVNNIPESNKETYSDLWVPTTSMTEIITGQNLPGNYKVAFLANSSDDFSTIKNEFEERRKKIELPPSKYNKWEHVYFILDSKLEMLSRKFSGDIHSPNTTITILLLILFILLFMTLPALNLMNINISRIMERSSEIGVRKSFGASSGDLMKQFLVENIMLSLVGSLIAFVFTLLILGQINNMGLVANVNFVLNVRVFCLGIGFAIIFGILSGVLPAYKMAKLNPVIALKGA